MAQSDDVRTSTIALVGFLGALVLFVILVGLEVVYYEVAARQRKAKETVQPQQSVTAALDEQRVKLAEYRRLDAAKGVVRIPIDRAMELVVRELTGGPTQEANHGAKP